MEDIDLDRIIELKLTRMEIGNLVDKEKSLSSPFSTDYAGIRNAYETFVSSVAEADRTSAYHRKKFLFVVLYIFAPGVLLGDYMPKGLRGVLGDTLGIKSPTAISNSCSDLLFLYQNYKDFRDGVHSLFKRISPMFGCISRDESESALA